jgi:hypothetical protein
MQQQQPRGAGESTTTMAAVTTMLTELNAFMSMVAADAEKTKAAKQTEQQQVDVPLLTLFKSMAEKLFQSGAINREYDVSDATTTAGQKLRTTVLFSAVFKVIHNHLPVEYVAALVEAGADPCVQTGPTGSCPIHYACWHGNVETIRALTKATAKTCSFVKKVNLRGEPWETFHPRVLPDVQREIKTLLDQWFNKNPTVVLVHVFEELRVGLAIVFAKLAEMENIISTMAAKRQQ